MVYQSAVPYTIHGSVLFTRKLMVSGLLASRRYESSTLYLRSTHFICSFSSEQEKRARMEASNIVILYFMMDYSAGL